ncbi:hypothetical protein H072_11496 [Dactylellina haptotyla CBS 200.50]|uniref:Coiled-coil domain-containing protein 16 n=1 Tax=Dactylellina haptotyla (strain CBS 200.50) TaxID=1284197 RepID=S8A1S7_DACHA|nr:hypothetical protein H072_11496 [Dactylellina haptotyla CBS 200.50]
MSAVDPRKLLAASRKSRRIASPYASYSLAGALFCNICSNTPIKSESLWDAHAASVQHKANVARKGGIVGAASTPTTKSHKRPAESPTQDARSRDDQTAGSKRLKTARADVKNLALPVGFFDDSDDEEEEEAVVSTGEVIEPYDEASKSTPQQPAATAAATANSKLPADFFSSTSNTTSKPPDTQQDDDLDDEWAAFQADIAETEEAETTNAALNPPSHTISAPALSAADIQQQQAEAEDSLNSRNTRTIAEEEMEDARAAMADFFDEQSSLEERVQRLKERREMLRRNTSTAPDVTAGNQNDETMGLDRSNSVRSVTMGGTDDAMSTTSSIKTDAVMNTGQDDEDDEDYEDDDDMFFRRR